MIFRSASPTRSRRPAAPARDCGWFRNPGIPRTTRSLSKPKVCREGPTRFPFGVRSRLSPSMAAGSFYATAWKKRLRLPPLTSLQGIQSPSISDRSEKKGPWLGWSALGRCDSQQPGVSCDAEFLLHFIQGDAFGFGIPLQDDEELQSHHGSEKDEGISAGFCRDRGKSK